MSAENKKRNIKIYYLATKKKLSVRQIAKLVGLKAASTVHVIIKRVEKKGVRSYPQP